MKSVEEIAKWIYEATRVEATWSHRSIVPEPWKERDDKFRSQFIVMIDKYLKMDKLPTPEKAHDSWSKKYFDMGWKYGKKRNVELKTHPDLVPFDKLPKDEQDKDSIFLSFVWLAKNLILEGYKKNIEEITNVIYETGRLEAKWSNRSVIPEPWEERDKKFKDQMISLIDEYLKMDKLPTPKEAHNIWAKQYFNMGWKYGKNKDSKLKTHPDLVPFDKLPKDEQDKDSIFLSFVWLVRHLI